MKLKFIEEKAMKVVMLVTTLLVFLFVGSILYCREVGFTSAKKEGC